MNKKTHSPNCLCGACTSFDPHIMHIRNQFGKNADFTNTVNGGSRYGYNDYDAGFNHADAVIIPHQANLKQILGDALGSVVGDLIQAKKDGQTLPPLLDKVAGLGIKTEQAAVNAATGKAQSEVGKQVLTFSPYIIGGLVLIVLVVVFMLGRK